MRRQITIALTSAVLLLPVADAAAAHKSATKAKVVIMRFSGSTVEVDRFGPLQVTIVVKKTTTTSGARKKVTRKITALSVPVYPNHTGRSQYINQTALPYLRGEALSAQSAHINLISGATYTSYAFAQSLQAAILKEKRA